MPTIAKVWIEEDCITCDACEDILPEVFAVIDDSSQIKSDVREDGLLDRNTGFSAIKAEFRSEYSELIEEAADACPVEIIKFEYEGGVAEAVAEVESVMEEEQESESDSKEEKQDSKETKADKAKAVQAIVTRVLQAVSMAGGDTDSTKLALMGILGTPGFSSYQQQEMPDVAFYDTTVAYDSITYIDPLSNVFLARKYEFCSKKCLKLS